MTDQELDLDALAANAKKGWVLQPEKTLSLIDVARRTDKPSPCKMTRTEPYDFAQCETHDETFPLGGRCRFDGRDSIAEVYSDEADEQRWRAIKAGRQRDVAQAAVARVKALHAPIPARGVVGDCAVEECDHEDIRDCEWKDFEVCGGCEQVVAGVDKYWREHSLGAVPYPCATIRAIEDGESDA